MVSRLFVAVAVLAAASSVQAFDNPCNTSPCDSAATCSDAREEFFTIVNAPSTHKNTGTGGFRTLGFQFTPAVDFIVEELGFYMVSGSLQNAHKIALFEGSGSTPIGVGGNNGVLTVPVAVGTGVTDRGNFRYVAYSQALTLSAGTTYTLMASYDSSATDGYVSGQTGSSQAGTATFANSINVLTSCLCNNLQNNQNQQVVFNCPHDTTYQAAPGFSVCTPISNSPYFRFGPNLFGRGVSLYKCDCPAGMTGTDCSTDINECDSSPCENGATCTTPSPNSFSCQCAPGYTGTTCESDIDECASTPCENGATCTTDNINSFGCVCPAGWTGTTCDTDINECDSTPCENGATCANSQTPDMYACLCANGYTGTNCETDIDECASTPCANGGSCSEGNTANLFICTCAVGWTGTKCEVEIDECDSSPCENGGTCTEGSTANLFECTCGDGFTGTQCETDINECESQPCSNGGSCSQGTSADLFECTCVTGFTGTMCESDINECDSSPCANGGVCDQDSMANVYFCTCEDGFTGEQCESDINECASLPCENGGTCSQGNSPDNFACLCAAGYTGDICETDIQECESSPCTNAGTCSDDQGAGFFTCACQAGFTGTKCEQDIDECASSPCENGGTCTTSTIDAFSCICGAGYTGTQCETNIDECVSDPCENGGTCNDMVDGYSCTCVLGYTGTHCESEIDECASSPCTNAASCLDSVDGYSCSCHSGFTGTHCETEINECVSTPCENGATCTDNVDGYSCICAAGYTGTQCETNIDECVSDPCENGGTCNDMVDGYTCTCVLGYTGTHCESEINECASSPCTNAATCTDSIDGYSCSCHSGFTGTHCETEINECVSTPCENGATCTDNVDGYSCMCVAGYTGTQCETNIDECVSDPCENGGTCNDMINSYTCMCVLGYTGTHCETNIDECVSSPCTNAGTCFDGVNSYSCSCHSGFTGTHCEQNINECNSCPCQNGASCSDGVDGYSCTCVTGYTGTHCESDIDECASSPCSNGATCGEGALWSFAGLPTSFEGGSLPSGFTTSTPVGSGTGFTQSTVNGQNGNPLASDGVKALHVDETDIIARSDVTIGPITLFSAGAKFAFKHLLRSESGFGLGVLDISLDNGGTWADITTKATFEAGTYNHQSSATTVPMPNLPRSTWSGQIGVDNVNFAIQFVTVRLAFSNSLVNQPFLLRFSFANDQGTSYAGWFIDEMALLPSDGGVQVNYYECTCAAGFTGAQCETDIDECVSTPCENGGSCDEGNQPDFFNCQCPSGFTGPQCESDLNECDSNPCQNSGSCTDGSDMFTCICVAGYTGSKCEVDINECASSPCTNGGTCTTPNLNAYECACPSGFSGAECATDDNECDSNPCENGGTCSEGNQPDYFECTCVAGWSGPTCTMDIDECGSMPCLNGGTCSVPFQWASDAYPMDFDSDTVPNFSGPWVAKSIVHSPPKTSNNFVVEQEGNDRRRDVPNQYADINSQANIDEVLEGPLITSTNTQGYVIKFQHRYSLANDAATTLEISFDGENFSPIDDQSIVTNDPQVLFDSQVNDATNPLHGQHAWTSTLNSWTQVSLTISVPVAPFAFALRWRFAQSASQSSSFFYSLDDITIEPVNGGSEIDVFSCQCPQDFIGAQCETNIDDCLSAPCANGGTCNNGVVSYTCTCPAGFTGISCQNDINECDSNPCQNGGTCSNGNTPNLYTCTCVVGTTGSSCETDIDECASNPCQNGGTCVEGQTFDSYTCSCATGSTGTWCETDIDECASSPCQNGATCVEGQALDSYTCTCATGTTGTWCETDVDECASNPCSNGGTCEEGSAFDWYTCDCLQGTTGTWCETVINECESNPCVNGATCIESNDFDLYTCVCVVGSTGTHCETDIDECASNPCQNGGTCVEGQTFDSYTCTCATGFTGTQCQVLDDSCGSNPCQHGGSCSVDGTPSANGFDMPVHNFNLQLSGVVGYHFSVDSDRIVTGLTVHLDTLTDVSGTVQLAILDDSTVLATVTITPNDPTATSGTGSSTNFLYKNLATPVTLTAGTVYSTQAIFQTAQTVTTIANSNVDSQPGLSVTDFFYGAGTSFVAWGSVSPPGTRSNERHYLGPDVRFEDVPEVTSYSCDCPAGVSGEHCEFVDCVSDLLSLSSGPGVVQSTTRPGGATANEMVFSGAKNTVPVTSTLNEPFTNNGLHMYAWVKPVSVSPSGGWIMLKSSSSGASSGRHYGMFVNLGNLVVQLEGQLFTIPLSATTRATWYHVSASVEGTTLTVVVNGAVAQTFNSVNAGLTYGDNTDVFTLGGRFPNNYLFVGTLESVGTCKTEQGLTGCDVANSPCHNGGTCIGSTVDDLTWTCSCASGFTGVVCADEIQSCESSPCSNGASCIEISNAYTCVCALGFSGNECETFDIVTKDLDMVVDSVVQAQGVNPNHALITGSGRPSSTRQSLTLVNEQRLEQAFRLVPTPLAVQPTSVGFHLFGWFHFDAPYFERNLGAWLAIKTNNPLVDATLKRYFGLFVRSTTLFFSYTTTSQKTLSLETGVDMALGWHSIAVSVSPSEVITLFLDGVQVGQQAAVGGAMEFGNQFDGVFMLGGRPRDPGQQNKNYLRGTFLLPGQLEAGMSLYGESLDGCTAANFPCQNGGTCSSGSVDDLAFTCACPSGVTGTLCEITAAEYCNWGVASVSGSTITCDCSLTISTGVRCDEGIPSNGLLSYPILDSNTDYTNTGGSRLASNSAVLDTVTLTGGRIDIPRADVSSSASLVDFVFAVDILITSTTGWILSHMTQTNLVAETRWFGIFVLDNDKLLIEYINVQGTRTVHTISGIAGLRTTSGNLAVAFQRVGGSTTESNIYVYIDGVVIGSALNVAALSNDNISSDYMIGQRARRLGDFDDYALRATLRHAFVAASVNDAQTDLLCSIVTHICPSSCSSSLSAGVTLCS